MRGHSSVKIGFAYSEKRITRRHISYWCHYFVNNEETQAVGWATSRGGGDLHPLYRFRCIGVLLLQLHNVRVHFKCDISQWYKPGEWGTENESTCLSWWDRVFVLYRWIVTETMISRIICHVFLILPEYCRIFVVTLVEETTNLVFITGWGDGDRNEG